MPTPNHARLLDSAIHAALAAIEVYNKPHFLYREQAFTILVVNAWELLLKAKLVADAQDDISTLYVRLKDGAFKTGRSGNPLTIELLSAADRIELPQQVTENLRSLVDIRDTAVHLFHDESVAYAVYALGAACLRNFERLTKAWFDRSLAEYHFYILPLAFAYNFQTLRPADFDRKPEAIRRLLQAVQDAQSRTAASSHGDFHFVCEITTTLVAAKAIATVEADLVTKVDPSATQVVAVRTQKLTDKYPLSYYEVLQAIRAEIKGVKQSQIDAVLKTIKGKSPYSAYNFRTKQQESNFAATKKLPKSITVIYNNDAVRLVVEELSKSAK